MAIERIEGGKKTEWSGRSRGSTIAAAAIAALALLFLFLGFKKFMLKTNYLEAMAAADGGRKSDVKSAAESALAWGGSHVEVRELLAKTYVDARQYPSALAEYDKVLAVAPKRASSLAGKGVILLRQADEEKDAKKSADLLKNARELLAEAKVADDNCLEAHVGLATADLIAALRGGDPAKVSKCRDAFQQILKRGGSGLSREGWIDLHVGLGRTLAGEKFNPEAGKNLSAGRALLPTSLPLEVNAMYLEAQQVAESSWTPESVKAARLNERLNMLRNRWTSTKDSDAIVDPWVALVLASASAYAKAGDKENFLRAVEFLDNQPKVKAIPRADYGRALLLVDRAKAEGINPSERSSYLSKALTALRNAAGSIADDPANAGMLALLHGHLGVLEENQGALGNNDTAFQKAVDAFLKAWEAEKKLGLPEGSYETRRNLAVIQKRRKKTDAAGHYDAATKLAAARPEPAIQKDADELKKFWEAKE